MGGEGSDCRGGRETVLIYNETGPSYDAATTNSKASRGLALRGPLHRARMCTRARVCAYTRAQPLFSDTSQKPSSSL